MKGTSKTETMTSQESDHHHSHHHRHKNTFQQGKGGGFKSHVEIDIEDIDADDEEKLETQLRDSLIKAFMVIFTNKDSQHLLLNKDLIDIAFNCLEYSNDCTLEAKIHVSRLISIIFKFP